MKYDYYMAVANDIECWMDKDGDPFDISQFKERDEAISYLVDELWDEDSITGNSSEYDDEYSCEEYLCHNFDLAIEACREYCVDIDHILYQVQKGRLARFLDTTIRCYVLPAAVEMALINWEEYGFKYKKEVNN